MIVCTQQLQRSWRNSFWKQFLKTEKKVKQLQRPKQKSTNPVIFCKLKNTFVLFTKLWKKDLFTVGYTYFQTDNPPYQKKQNLKCSNSHARNDCCFFNVWSILGWLMNWQLPVTGNKMLRTFLLHSLNSFLWFLSFPCCSDPVKVTAAKSKRHNKFTGFGKVIT